MMPKSRHGFSGDIMLFRIDIDHDFVSSIRADDIVIQRLIAGFWHFGLTWNSTSSA